MINAAAEKNPAETGGRSDRKIIDYNLKEELEHGVYVSSLVRELTAELGLAENSAYQLRLAGLLHDIGKLQLTNYLYGREEIASPLVIEEMKYVRMHPVLSWNILKDLGYSDIVLDAVRYHHEDFDGSGYPDHLVGEAIPLGARIIRVCDVFAALTSDRPYRERFEPAEAMSLMIDEIKHFDLRIVLAFQRVVHRGTSRFRVHFPITDESILAEAAARFPAGRN